MILTKSSKGTGEVCPICEKGSVYRVKELDIESRSYYYYYKCEGGCGSEYADADLVKRNKELAKVVRKGYPS